jgi:hypothetical protein
MAYDHQRGEPKRGVPEKRLWQLIFSNSRPWRDVLYDYSVGAICWRFDLNFALMSIL